MTDSVNDFLMGAGGRSAKFEKEGDKIVGFITHMEIRQQTDAKTQELKFWKDGNPMNQMVVTLQTTDFDSDDDDGLRKVYIKGQMQKAVADAVRKTGERGIAEGGELGVKFVSTAAPAARNLSGAKQYTAIYTPPVRQMVVGDPGPSDEPF